MEINFNNSDRMVALSTELDETIERLTHEINQLTFEGVVDGHPWYKNGIYLYIVHHADQHKEYIGADPNKQKAALASLDRWKRQQHLLSLISTHTNARKAVEKMFNTIMEILKRPENYDQVRNY